jgi:hypothetical protein
MCLPNEECNLNLAENIIVNNPLDMENIKKQQDADDTLLQQATKYLDCYTRKCIGTVDDIICYVKPGDPPTNGKLHYLKFYCSQQLSGFTK